MEIIIPKKVQNNFQSYILFADIHGKTKKSFGENIVFNFTETKIFESNMFSILASLIASLERRKNKLRLVGLQPSIQIVFDTC